VTDDLRHALCADRLAAAIGGFEYVEWNEASIPGVEALGYHVTDGEAAVPDAPGGGLVLDEEAFLPAVGAGGFTRATLIEGRAVGAASAG